jgi:hypothetical protein
MSNTPNQNKNPYSTVSASKRRAQRQAKVAQQSAARRQLSIIGADTNERAATARPSTVPRVAPRSAAKKIEASDSELTAQRLANPTRFVSEDDMRAAYTYVIRDLRSMGVLAVGLVVLLVVLAQILPR